MDSPLLPSEAPEAMYRLFSGALDGTLSEEDAAKLQSALREDARVRQWWFEFNDVECGLGELRPLRAAALVRAMCEEEALAEPSGLACEGPAPDVAGEVHGGAGGWGGGWRALAAGLAFSAGLGVYVWHGGSAPLGSEGRGIAEVISVQDALWGSPDGTFQPGDAIAPGQTLELFAGKARVRFSSGAEVTLLAPCIFEGTSRNSGFLTYGRVEARALGQAARGFTLETPTARMVDTGTEFVASTQADGDSRVEVKSGEVEVLVSGQPAVQRLVEGNVLAVEGGKQKVLIRVENGDGTPEFRFPSVEAPSGERGGLAGGQTSKKLAACLVDGHREEGSEVLREFRGGAVEDSASRASKELAALSRESGRVLVDLGKRVSVTKVNTYSWAPPKSAAGRRGEAAQRYALYGFSEDAAPRTDGEPDANGWELIGRVDLTEEEFGVAEGLPHSEQQVSSITAGTGTLGKYRYLLWQVLPNAADFSLAKQDVVYGQLDVYAAP
ncbi:MAG: hypothetical protein RLZZ142_2436 [Verrucomicrobiota bacterium]|jgi:hypothetical protein